MKTPRKIISVCLSFLLITLITVSGTLAYENIKQNIVSLSNDTENEFKVSIIRSGDIVDNKENPDFQILPIREGLSKDEILSSEQFINHEVFVENTGNLEAFVRVVFAFPSSLVEPDENGRRALHIVESSSENWVYLSESIEIDSQSYTLYIYSYDGTLMPDKKTSDSAISGFYLDSKVTNQNGAYYFGGKRLAVDQNGKFAFYTKAQATSPTEFTSAESAFEALGLPNFESQ